MTCTSLFRHAVGGAGIFLSMAIGQGVLAQQVDNDTVARIDQAKVAQERDLRGYVRHERYLLFRRDNEEASASILVNVTYDRDKGKKFDILSQEGSALLRKHVLQRVIDEQMYLSEVGNRGLILVTSSNYAFKNMTKDALGDKQCLRYDVIPKKDSIYLLDGHAWFDISNYNLVKISGQQAQSPSIWVGRAMITRTYVLVDGFALADRLEATSHSFFFGTTTVKIEYSDYSVMH